MQSWELGVTVNGVEHVTSRFTSFVDDISLAVAASFCSPLFLVKEAMIPDPLVVSCTFSPLLFSIQSNYV